ncbi:MAG TPA: hypothetical protein DEG17_25400 [Cyanobacteria bacterium UBA11149]|nr:hypothetical protein [Cyanobacteria bacterium UBA11367]HBE60028.1 hypothetical protein [Cyanobacteria bacterium UBA11366]HBK64407.1 hypothetical protein [Cyanobacteria bacterium UBA11166]HBR73402.1 hypothetical protein [Cyanobacteria bacterium UBA11159]HBS69046.1 hypothetical protein [Cyanobacteria bacterium UBA11153]HBW92113.1 hypothetical protein [Cyanobacteria bacterium UBA11149]HCA97342.1 hypothetical protein [Cyanobacteria bacterium UBA9226]
MIFGCGLSRTGNKSLGNALKVLGYNPVKYPKSIEELGVIYDAAVDITVIAWLDELDRKFPDAKWILTIRDMDSWLASCARWFGRSLEDCTPYKQSYLRHYRQIVYGTESFDPLLWQEVYHHHIDRINTKFEGCSDRLLVMDICQGESWEKLCHFLDKPIPDTPFPSIS